jgi:hypothetical protein
MRKAQFIIFILIIILVTSLSGSLFGLENLIKPQIMYVTTWGEKGNKPGQFEEPQGISVDPNGFIYVADTGNQRLQKFDSKGRFVAEIGGFGWRKEQFDEPVAVCAKNGLDVFVADFNNQRIERYDKDLHYLATFKTSENWLDHYQFGFPLDVDISTQGELFCLDGENNRVLKLDILGHPQISFGDFDSGEGRLIESSRFFISQEGKIFITDKKKKRIVVFDVLGNFLYTFGQGILAKPIDMTMIEPDLLLIVDSEKKDIFIFHQSGVLITSLKKRPLPVILFEEPVDVIYWNKYIMVLDKKRNVVDVFLWHMSEKMDVK